MAKKPPATAAEFLKALDHPLKSALLAVRSVILHADPAIHEGIKWNSPSYFVGKERYFGTLNIHGSAKVAPAVLLVLHRGAKKRSGRVTIRDPHGLLDWLGADRCAVRIGSVTEARAKERALQAIVREWIAAL